MQEMRKSARFSPPPIARAVPLLPVLAAMLIAALEGAQTSGVANWAGFASRFAMASVAATPLFVADLWISKDIRPASFTFWVLAFLAYPLIVVSVVNDGLAVAARHWLLAAMLSSVVLLTRLGKQSKVIAFVHRLPITLDAAVICLLAIWTIAATALFGSTADAVNNQPLHVWFDAERLVTHPFEFFSYGLQFAAIALLIFAFYWLCRNVLVRGFLHSSGWIAMALASLIFWIIYSPLACSLILLLPLNLPHWSVLPSENHNAFDSINYGVTLIFGATIMPVILASERLLAERSDAIGQQERARAELHVLQQQINPHFLFNALNTLYAMCLKDSPSSAGAIVKLSELLQYTVHQSHSDWAELDEEVAYLGNYVDLQLLRFGSRCRVSFHVPDATGHYRIPPLLLIMLVENAFKHGVEPQDEISDVRIDLGIENDRLRFTCVNAPLAPESQSPDVGVGLDNMRRRLELTMPGQYNFVSERRGHAWTAELELDLEPC